MSLYSSSDENIFTSINRCHLLIKFLPSKEDKNLAALHYVTRAISGFSCFVYA
ncbi:unnamed protein product [Acanthoscelides obtectus]|uniref:Uncharacterized protein n=1 Tax=Acanthoscelides obtectus TaxID=200917 RepID=A0A9P0KS45_ACAOB|nr:unnamed protein product [Acanthoscelides obtectus]CAK1628643.1 hypothetical protein AOBTE_LOCUS5321 [Acanthoscelides obtectus]